MEIYREIIDRLVDWKLSPDRRPLIIQGARQIGKTWVMKKFGSTCYHHVAYFNFDASQELAKEFSDTRQPERLIKRLELYCQSPILPDETLIIFDEIQECPDALNALKYFCEDYPQYHVIAAGSLLGVAIHRHKGFPVGKVDFLHMYPVTFREYLRTSNKDLVEYIDRLETVEPLPEVVSGKIWDEYRRYQVCGGMPKAVLASLEGRGMDVVTKEQDEILTSYFYDFTKHASASDFVKIAAVWQSLPSQLAKENRKFVYKAVKPGARAREYENALSWLREAGLIYQIFCCSKPGLPLSAFDDLSAFKIYMLDIGLLRALAKLPAAIFSQSGDSFVEFKGALAENFIAQSLVPQLEQLPRYWVSTGTAEVDFIIQEGIEIYPVEVKAADNTAGKSLSVYISKYQPSFSIIFSAKPLSISGSEGKVVLNIPTPLVDWLPSILDLSVRSR